ncbi:MAG TPA: alpha/beta hydrolase [Ramlibacter sp.]|uniref:alpha/beta fold hydrolase n=1 Tax=Ramlibacter sp. TaxID=1917967 RepID=UPI002D0AC426|nr:alpha/beta hydrolase [Ramlibacter sp.]HVZ44561.1 alpha/beta hydrolase [Ramlibacter sp.]
MFTLVLLPGLAGNAVMWRSQLEALRSWRPTVTDVHSQHDSIEAMASALLAQHAGELVLCGASMGGMLAMQAVREAPQRIRGIALLGTNPRPEDERMRALREAAIALFEDGRLAEVIEPNVGFAFHPEHARDRALVEAYLGFVYEAGAAQLIRQNRAVMARPDAREHLPNVTCPVLVMCGEDDQLTPPECSREIASLVAHAELVTVPRCGHMLTMEQPQIVNAQLMRWLAALAA